MSINYTKTQVLLPSGDYGPPRYFRRKRTTALTNREGKVLREMGYPEWMAFKKRWQEEVERDGLSLRIIWVLKEVQV